MTSRKLLFVAFFAATFLCALPSPASQPDWVLESQAGWQARDSQAEWVFRDQLWIGGGWFNSFEASPRDVWASSDGRQWQRVQPDAPWLHSDLPISLTFQDRMWLMGGWYNGRLPGHSASNQVWSSTDGLQWKQEASSAAWSPRCAGTAVAFKGQIWLAGGTENYYFGDDQSLKNDVWKTSDGSDWQLVAEHSAWQPRAYHQSVVFNERIYLFGGGNYVPKHHALSDVWSSADGVNWQCETTAAPWKPRLWFSSVLYRNRIWVVGGWSEASGNLGDVWHSADGKDWQRFETGASWSPRHEHSAFVFQDKLWVAGGHAQPLSNEVWSLTLPSDWQP